MVKKKPARKKTTRKNAVQAKPFAIATGRQLSIDTSRLFILDRQTQWAKLDRWQKLTLFESLYRSQEIATGAVNLLVRLINTRMVPKVDNPEVAKRMVEIWDEINGPEVNAMMSRQYFVFGFTTGEWVSDDMESMTRVVVPPSIEIRKIPDKQGQIESYIQLPGFLPGIARAIDGRTVIPPIKVIDLVRDPLNSMSSSGYYGSSLYESCVDQFESLCKILDAQIRVYMRLGRPRFCIEIPAEGITPEQFQERINEVTSVLKTMGNADSADLVLPAGCKISIVGAESFGQRFADESRMVLSQLCSGIGIPAGLLNVVINSTGNSESFVRQQVIALITQISEVQRNIAHAWNKSFWQVVQRMERMPTAPVMGFETPRLLEQTLEEQARDLRFNNDVREVVYGIRDFEWLVQRCGATEAADLEALKEQIENQRAMMEPQDLNTPDSGKQDSHTKGTDARASKNTTI